MCLVGAGHTGKSFTLRDLAAVAGDDTLWVRGVEGDAERHLGALERASGVRGPAARDSVLHRSPDLVVAVDDAHRLDDATLGVLAEIAVSGGRLLVAHRRSPSPALAVLHRAVMDAGGSVQPCGPLPIDDLGSVLALAGGRAVDTDWLAVVHQRSAGLVGHAVALLGLDACAEPPATHGQRIEADLALVPGGRAVVVAMAVDSEPLPDGVVAAAVGATPDELRHTLGRLEDAGLVVGDRLVPVVADAVTVLLGGSERRQVEVALARAHLEAGRPVPAASVLSSERGEVAALAFASAGRVLAQDDPVRSIELLERAREAGVGGGEVDTAYLTALALAGDPRAVPAVEELRDADPGVRGVVEAHDGHLEPARRLLARASDPWLGHQASVLTAAAGEPVDDTDGEPSLPEQLAALVATLVRHGRGGVTEAAIVAGRFERLAGRRLLVDSPHAASALVLVAAGDDDAAARLAGRALESEVGGAALARRHRLVHAWVRLRGGAFSEAVGQLESIDWGRLAGRDQLLAAGLAAGLARRSGNIDDLRAAWKRAGDVVLRGGIDLVHVDVVLELAVCAARLGEIERARMLEASVVDGLDALGRPSWSTAAWCWRRCEMGIGADDVSQVAAALEDWPADELSALRSVAACWVDVLGGRVDADDVLARADELVAAVRPWEASRLLGQAALRVRGSTEARSLLERARQVGASTSPASDASADLADSGLSEREIEVARLVIDGHTHKDIGHRLFISPKTVEHHVANIRTKLGTQSRAEMLAALRSLLDDPSRLDQL